MLLKKYFSQWIHFMTVFTAGFMFSQVFVKKFWVGFSFLYFLLTLLLQNCIFELYTIVVAVVSLHGFFYTVDFL